MIDSMEIFSKTYSNFLSVFQSNQSEARGENDEMFHSTTTIYYILKSNYVFIDEIGESCKRKSFGKEMNNGKRGILMQKGVEWGGKWNINDVHKRKVYYLTSC